MVLSTASLLDMVSNSATKRETRKTYAQNVCLCLVRVLRFSPNGVVLNTQVQFFASIRADSPTNDISPTQLNKRHM